MQGRYPKVQEIEFTIPIDITRQNSLAWWIAAFAGMTVMVSRLVLTGFDMSGWLMVVLMWVLERKLGEF